MSLAVSNVVVVSNAVVLSNTVVVLKLEVVALLVAVTTEVANIVIVLNAVVVTRLVAVTAEVMVNKLVSYDVEMAPINTVVALDVFLLVAVCRNVSMPVPLEVLAVVSLAVPYVTRV